MALRAVRADADPAPPSLDERVAEAQRAEARPRSRVAGLQAAFDTALRERRFTDADGLQADLASAREALAVAEGTTAGMRAALAAVAQQQAAEQASLAEGRRQEEANLLLGDAIVAEGRARDGIEESLAAMRATLGAARDAYHRAVAGEGTVRAAQQQAINARQILGQYPPGTPPRAPGANKASALVDVDPLIRELARGRG